MSFMTWIVNWLDYIGDFFYELYLDCYYAGFPLDILDTWFYAISGYFYNLAQNFYYFNEWVDDTAAKVVNILSYDNIYSHFKGFFDAAINAWDWVVDSFWNVWDIADDWWSSKRSTVQGWIAIAVEGLDNLKVAWSNFWNITLPELLSNLNSLRAEWDNFWTQTFPTLINISWLTTWWDSKLADIQSLMDSAFLLRSSFWEGWQDWRDKVTEFITDPEQWFYDRLEEIFERFW